MNPALCADFNLEAVPKFFDGLLREICGLLPMGAVRWSAGARNRRNMGDPCYLDRESRTSILGLPRGSSAAGGLDAVRRAWFAAGLPARDPEASPW